MRYLGEGNSRIVYLSRCGKYVRKFPKNETGILDNYREFSLFSRGSGYIPLAKCRLHNSGILIMEYVEQVSLDNLPDWCDFVDCRQVGYNRYSQLVAYDYA